jgi:hypothetical protein
MAEISVQKRVSHELPDLAPHRENRDQRKPFVHPPEIGVKHLARDEFQQEDGGAGDDDAFHPSCKGREAERDGLSARHDDSWFKSDGTPSDFELLSLTFLAAV